MVGFGDSSDIDPSVLVQQSALDDKKEDDKPKGVRRAFQSKGSYNRGPTCNSSKTCFRVCRNMFQDDAEIDICAELKEGMVFEMEEVIEILEKDLNYPALRRVEEDAFEEIMEISTDPWVNLTDNVDQDEAESLLTWIAANDDIAEIIKKYDKTGNYKNKDFYEGFHKLMKEVSKSKGCSLYGNFATDKISGNRTFCQIAKDPDNNNTTAMSIFREIFDNESCDSRTLPADCR